MKTNCKLSANQRGVVSMVAVILISILLSIVSLAIMRLTLDEQRGSTELMLSTKAFYAAEAGVEDILYETNGNLTDKQNCHPVTDNISLESDGRVGYTCRLLIVESDKTSGTILPNQARQLDLSGGTFQRLLVRWHRQGEAPSTLGSSYYTNNPPNLQAAPPIMRIEVISFGSGGLSREGIGRRVIFARPIPTGGVIVETPVTTFTGSNLYTNTASNVNARCPSGTTAGEYVCQLRLTGFVAGTNYIVRLSTLYDHGPATSFEVLSQTNANLSSPQTVFDSIIDVTARASDVYRRVQYRMPDENRTNILPFGLLSGNRICKGIEVNTATHSLASGVETGCNN